MGFKKRKSIMINSILFSGVILLLFSCSDVTDPIEDPEPILKGLVAHYPLNGNVNDISGNFNDGIIQGWLSFNGDRFEDPSCAARFDGETSCILIEDTPSLRFENTEATIACWFKGLDWFMYDGYDYRLLPLIAREENTPDDEPGSGDFELMVMDKIIGFWPYATFKYDFHLYSWYFVAVTAKDKEFKLYVNGKFIGQDTSDIHFHLSEKPIHIGANLHKGDDYLNGYMDDVRIYSRQLNESEILELYEEKGYIPKISFTQIPEIGSFKSLKGVCEGRNLQRFQVAVFIHTSYGWFNKPYWAAPVTDINEDGTWECDITTGEDDELAIKICAFLIEDGYNIPILDNAVEIPQQLYDDALRYIEIIRK